MNRLIPVTIVVALTLTVTGCAPGGESETKRPAIEHVHGIAQDPRGTDLLVATHNGVFTVSASGKVSGPIGGDTFDAMGFTVAGDVFFASGHPGPSTPAELGSPDLGIIRSDDYGRTWSPVALNGGTDFHVLTRGPDGVLYGIASGGTGILVSTDSGREWTRGAAVTAADLVATKTGLYAATEAGLLLSTDRGATFVPLASAPVLYTLDARSDGTLTGVDTKGELWTQNAGGAWESVGRVVGVVQAFSVVNNDRIVLVDDRGIVELTSSGPKILSPIR